MNRQNTSKFEHINKVSKDLMNTMMDSFKIFEGKCVEEQPVCDLLNLIDF